MNLPNNTLLQGGKYKIVRFISSGGFGCTYEGVHMMMDTKVAIKEFFVKEYCNRDETSSQVSVGTQAKADLVAKLRKKFVEETRSVFQMLHPGIVRVLDIFEENGTAYYVMDFIDGQSLQDIIKQRGSLPEAEAVGYIRQVAEALQYVHSKNRLHLDIKPGNIMIDRNGRAYLIDFGASKHYDEESGENTSTLLGVNTRGYAPVEQSTMSFTKFSPATDIYALGATLYKALTGITPPDANLLMSEDETLAPLPATISEKTRKAVEMAMQVKRKDRVQSIEEFLAIIGTPVKKEEMKEPVSKPVVVEDEATILDTGRVETKKEEYNPKTATAAQTISQTVTPKLVTRTNTVSGTENLAQSKQSDSGNETKSSFEVIIGWGVIALVLIFMIMSVLKIDSSSTSRNYSSHQTAAPAPKQDSTVKFATFYDAKGTRFTYSGKVKNGKPNGEGTGWYSYGKYVGEYIRGYRWGQGKFTYKDVSQTFEGTFINDNYDKGTIRLSDGTHFKGTFQHGQPYNGSWYNSKGQLISNVEYGNNSSLIF